MSPQAPTRARWKVVAGYAAFSLVAFILCLYVTFPYEALKRRAVQAAASAGWSLTMGSLGPGLFGVTASNLRLSKTTEAQPPAPETGAVDQGEVEPLQLASVSARPALFPPGLAVRARAFGGNISGAVGGLSNLKMSISFEGLDPTRGNLKGFTGVDMAGTASGALSLSLPREARAGASAGWDLSAANGTFTLNLDKLIINGGSITVPVYGQPTPVDLPRIVLGDLEGKLKIEKGLATIERLSGKGEDLELQGQGTIKLAKQADYSELNVELKIKAEPAFIKRLGLLGGGLSVLPADKDDPSFRVAKITGFLGRPAFNPGR